MAATIELAYRGKIAHLADLIAVIEDAGAGAVVSGAAGGDPTLSVSYPDATTARRLWDAVDSWQTAHPDAMLGPVEPVAIEQGGAACRGW